MKDSISVLLTVYNQEHIIKDIFYGVMNNISRNVRELVVVFDGCTDKSFEILKIELDKVQGIIVKYIETPNLNETLANNRGFELCTCDYIIIVQDDCLIKEKDFDLRMLKPFKVVPNLLAVSGRDAVDTRIVNGKLDYYNTAGADVNTPKNIFSIRDAVNRAPLMLHNARAKELGYFDKDFAPLDSDDVDLSIRGYKEFGYLVGSYVIDFESRLQWGKTRSNSNSARIWEASMRKNQKLILERHHDFIIGEKHTKDMEIK